MKKTLVIIDVQKDFYNKNGNLYVKDGEIAEHAIFEYINQNADNLAEVVFTVDCHPIDHCSFKKNGGDWPVHCLNYSEGAGVSDKLINACIEHNIPIKFFKKGTLRYKEEYGAFYHTGTIIIGSINHIVVNNMEASCMVMLDTNNIVISGIAGDYCVKSSIENLLKYKGPSYINIEVFKNGIVSIDNGETLDNFINENNLKVI